jgi:hypothetical protein
MDAYMKKSTQERIISKWIFKKKMGICKMDISGSG